jgi:hypothetical protein
MFEFLIETYLPASASAHALLVAEVSRAAEELNREGGDVCFQCAIFVPEDEVCFYLCRSGSIEAVRDAAARAGLRFERITPAVSTTGADGGDGST